MGSPGTFPPLSFYEGYVQGCQTIFLSFILSFIRACWVTVMSSYLWPHGLQPARLPCPWDFPGKNTRVGCHFLLQGIFLTQGSNPCLLLGRQVLYHRATREAPYFWPVFDKSNQYRNKLESCTLTADTDLITYIPYRFLLNAFGLASPVPTGNRYPRQCVPLN